MSRVNSVNRSDTQTRAAVPREATSRSGLSARAGAIHGFCPACGRETACAGTAPRCDRCSARFDPDELLWPYVKPERFGRPSSHPDDHTSTVDGAAGVAGMCHRDPLTGLYD